MLPLKDPLFERILTPNLPGRFPSTRFQGSKRKILRELALALSAFEFSNCLDLYAGSGSVSLLLRVLGKKVDANDYLAFSRLSARLFLTVKAGDFANLDYYRDLKWLLETKKTEHKSYVSDIYAGIFFTDRENAQIDNFAQNIDSFSDYRRDLYTLEYRRDNFRVGVDRVHEVVFIDEALYFPIPSLGKFAKEFGKAFESQRLKFRPARAHRKSSAVLIPSATEILWIFTRLILRSPRSTPPI